jgi:hypothetical protein
MTDEMLPIGITRKQFNKNFDAYMRVLKTRREWYKKIIPKINDNIEKSYIRLHVKKALRYYCALNNVEYDYTKIRPETYNEICYNIFKLYSEGKITKADSKKIRIVIVNLFFCS